MDFLERARRGLITSDQDEDIGEFLDALERGHSLCERFNVPGTSRDARRGILEKLFGQPLDPRTSINPSFRCDVGTNIHLGRHVEVNFDCVFLDSAEITIGEFRSSSMAARQRSSRSATFTVSTVATRTELRSGTFKSM